MSVIGLHQVVSASRRFSLAERVFPEVVALEWEPESDAFPAKELVLGPRPQ